MNSHKLSQQLPSDARAAVGNLIGSFLGGENELTDSDPGAATCTAAASASADTTTCTTSSSSSNGEMSATCTGQPAKSSSNDSSNEEASNVDNDRLIIRSWTPSTSHLLTATTSSGISSVSASPPPYFDVLDHVLGSSLPPQILQEVQALRKDGIISDFKPARTAMEVKSDNLVALLGGFATMDDGIDESSDATAAAATTTTTTAATDNSKVRGDRSVFIPRSLHRPSQNVNYDRFVKRCPGLLRLISSIEQTAVQHLAPAIQIDTEMTSVQIASYPGDGISGYPRHCDRGDKCAKEPMVESAVSKDAEDQGGNATRSSSKRIVTAVYYLTPADWDADLDGGALRVYAPGPPPLPSNDDGELASHRISSYHYDAVPYSDRLVVFRSDLIEHEVMPSLRRDRIAITVWLYGRSTATDGGGGAVGSRDSFGVITPMKAEESSKSSVRATPRNPPPPLPISEALAKPNETASRIFVSIPSYRDPETNRTISSLFETARYPERVYVGVVWQIDTSSENVDAACFRYDLPKPWSTTNVRELKLDYRQATGPCLARALAQNLHRDEEYILQIDSHMRFRANWDVYLLAQLAKCPNKSILTAYPPAYVLDADGEAEFVNNETRGTILAPWKFSDGMLRQKGRLLSSSGTSQPELEDGINDNVPCPLYAAGFNFSSSSVIKDCPYDATLHHLFFGEEMSMAVRLFTHGYDFFAPPQCVCYHKWTRDHRPTIQGDTRSTEDETSKDKRDDSMAQQQRRRSLDVVFNQLRGNSHSLGSIRTASEFASRVGVDFHDSIIHPGAEDCGLPSDAFAPYLFLGEAGSNADTEDLTGGNNDNIVHLVSSFLSAGGR